MLKIFNHLQEFKVKCSYLFFGYFLTFWICYLFSPQLITLLSNPILNFVKLNTFDFIFTNIFEVFNTYFIMSYYCSIFFYFPIFLYSILNFIKPGLFKYEKNFLFSLLKTIMLFNFLSFVLIYFFVFPSMLSFLLSLDLANQSKFIVLKIQPRLYDYIIFFSQFLFFYSILMFQFPFLIIILGYFINLSPLFFYKKRRVFILAFLTLGCLFSSPDICSLFLISFPLFIFYEIIIFITILKNNYKKYFLF